MPVNIMAASLFVQTLCRSQLQKCPSGFGTIKKECGSFVPTISLIPFVISITINKSILCR